jgi:hypothetical protein
VRGSDYLGPGVGGNGHVTRVLPAALRGRRVTMFGRTRSPTSATSPAPWSPPPRTPVLTAAALASPLLRELRQLSYQWERPYVLDSSAAQERFGIAPTPWDEVCRRTANG